MKKSSILEVTEEEREALRSYQGNSNLINELLGNYFSDSALSLYRSDDGPYYANKRMNDQEHIADLLNKIQLIYSAMYKVNMGKENSITVYRGSSRSMTENKAQSFLSTTTKREEALLFATSKSFYGAQHYYLSTLMVDKDVPRIVMPTKGNENEILVSPFVELVKKESFGGSWSGYAISREDLVVKQCPLKELSQEAMDSLESEVLGKAKEMGMLIQECLGLRRKLDILPNRTAEQYETYSQVSNELSQKTKIVEEWKSKFRTLAEGKCREIEKRITQALEKEAEMAKQLQLEREKKEALQKQKEQENAQLVTAQIKDDKQKVFENLQKVVQFSRFLKERGVAYVSPTENAIRAIQGIDFRCEYASEDAISESRQMMSEFVHCAKQLGNELARSEENEFKRAIEAKVLEIRMKQEERILLKRSQTIENQKIGIVGRVLGKQRKREMEQQKVNQQLQNLRNFASQLNQNGLSQEIRYSAHDIVSELEVSQLRGNLTEKEEQELRKYRAVIYQVYPEGTRGIRPEKVKQQVAAKMQGLQGEAECDFFVAQRKEMLSKQSFRNRRETNAERICRKVNMAMKAFANKERAIHNEPNRWNSNMEF